MLANGGLDNSTSAQARRRRPVQHDAVHAPHLHHQAPQPLIVIDPGHGGKDPGCIGPSGLMEKQVVLAIGLALRRQLLASRHCRIVMTRSTDVFVPLEERVRFAQQHGAAVMISLHANSSADSRAHGANVYRFAFHASDQISAAVERLENSADRFEGTTSGSRPTIVLQILARLMRRETMLHSAALQRDLVAELDAHWGLCGGGARHARFVVLSAPDVASVLVEMGFLTNRADTEALSLPSHQAVLARTISVAIDRFLAGLPQARRGLG
jgi:N-acetylmuramoyl-L-alanine amidase